MAVVAAGSPSECLYRPRPDPRSFGTRDRSRCGRGGRLSDPPHESPLASWPLRRVPRAPIVVFRGLRSLGGHSAVSRGCFIDRDQGNQGSLKIPAAKPRVVPQSRKNTRVSEYYRRALMRLGRPRFSCPILSFVPCCGRGIGRSAMSRCLGIRRTVECDHDGTCSNPGDAGEPGTIPSGQRAYARPARGRTPVWACGAVAVGRLRVLDGITASWRAPKPFPVPS